MLCNKVDNLCKKTIKNQAKTPKAIDCLKLMRCKHLPCGPTEQRARRSLRFLALGGSNILFCQHHLLWQTHLPQELLGGFCTPLLLFFVRRPRSACHLERAFNLLGHILTHEHLNMSNEMLRHLAIMYVNKMAKKCKYEEE